MAYSTEFICSVNRIKFFLLNQTALHVFRMFDQPTVTYINWMYTYFMVLQFKVPGTNFCILALESGGPPLLYQLGLELKPVLVLYNLCFLQVVSLVLMVAGSTSAPPL